MKITSDWCLRWGKDKYNVEYQGYSPDENVSKSSSEISPDNVGVAFRLCSRYASELSPCVHRLRYLRFILYPPYSCKDVCADKHVTVKVLLWASDQLPVVLKIWSQNILTIRACFFRDWQTRIGHSLIDGNFLIKTRLYKHI